jgi:hypothetical protein
VIHQTLGTIRANLRGIKLKRSLIFAEFNFLAVIFLFQYRAPYQQ